jgi:hypothetical protein
MRPGSASCEVSRHWLASVAPRRGLYLLRDLPNYRVRLSTKIVECCAVNQLLAASPASPESAASVVTRLDQAGLIREDDGLGPVAEAEFGE